MTMMKPLIAKNRSTPPSPNLQNSGSKLLFVDNDVSDGKQPGRVNRVRAKLPECPEVQKVVLFEGAPGGERESTHGTAATPGQGHGSRV